MLIENNIYGARMTARYYSNCYINSLNAYNPMS